MADDNRLPTNQSQLDIATALNGIASALTPQNTVNADSIYPVETSPSTHAYNEGDHLIVSGVTYVAIDDIAIGDSLVLNTNIQAETLATRMNHIEQGIEDVDNKTWTDLGEKALNDEFTIPNEAKEISVHIKMANAVYFGYKSFLISQLTATSEVNEYQNGGNHIEYDFTWNSSTRKIRISSFNSSSQWSNTKFRFMWR